MGKRKYCETAEPTPKKGLFFILHVPGLPEYGNFTQFSSCKIDETERLSHLHGIRDIRLNEPINSPHLMENICDQIPLTLDGFPLETTGYHQNRYKKFHVNLSRLQTSKTSASGVSSSSSKKGSLRQPKSSADISEEIWSSFLFPDLCIFCDKPEIKAKGKTGRLAKFQSWKHKDPAWKVIVPRARELNNENLYRKVQGKDLFAMETKFHPTCRNIFNTEYQNHICSTEIAQRSSQSSSIQVQNAAAHQNAYAMVKDYIHSYVIINKEVVQATILHNVYIEELEKEGFPNPDYRTEKLIARLQGDEDISQAIAFSKVPLRGCFELYFIYNSTISTAEAISCAYNLGTRDQLQDAAVTPHSIITKAFRESKELSWPPTSQDVNCERIKKILPPYVVKFFNMLLTGTLDINGETCEQTQRVKYSITQDVCRDVTSGRWKLPKHILICATLRHLYLSKQVSIL